MSQRVSIAAARHHPVESAGEAQKFRTPPRVTLDSPIEALDLSRRARNALRKAGFDTIGGLLENDGSSLTRHIGAITRDEVIAALRENGIETPAALVEARKERISGLTAELHRLREQIDENSRHLQARVERLESRIRKLDSGEDD